MFSAIEISETIFKLNCKHLDIIVLGILSDSVVAIKNTTCSGGSSKVLSIAFQAFLESI